MKQSLNSFTLTDSCLSTIVKISGKLQENQSLADIVWAQQCYKQADWRGAFLKPFSSKRFSFEEIDKFGTKRAMGH